VSDIDNKGIDLGVIIRDSDASLRFYRDTLGLDHIADIEMPAGVMHRLQWGTSLVKLTRPLNPPEATNPPGGIQTATGLRYFTLTVPDLDAIVARSEAGGYTTVIAHREVRPGVVIAMVEDPDGNWVEFLQA
jgi:catechol 2,3-dioxygenase-like lactoylglutathione lyase family enzyme